MQRSLFRRLCDNLLVQFLAQLVAVGLVLWFVFIPWFNRERAAEAPAPAMVDAAPGSGEKSAEPVDLLGTGPRSLVAVLQTDPPRDSLAAQPKWLAEQRRAAWDFLHIVQQRKSAKPERKFDYSAYDAWRAEMTHPDPLVRRYVALGLGHLMTDKSVESFADSLEERSWYLRTERDDALDSSTVDWEAYDAVDKALADPDHLVRCAAVTLLVEDSPSSSSIDKLIALLSDEHPRVRAVAAIGLGRMVSATQTDTYYWVSTEAKERLKAALLERMSAEREKDLLVRVNAADALARAEPSTEMIDQFVRLLGEDDPLMRETAARCLALAKSPGIAEALAPYQNDEQERVAEHIRFALTAATSEGKP